MIIGIGIDLIELKRVEKVYNRYPEKFIHRLLSFNERAILANTKRSLEFIAGRFAAKEAIAKAFGTGIGKIRWTEIEILHGNQKQPEVKLSGEALKTAERFQAKKILVSISHTKETAVANALITNELQTD